MEKRKLPHGSADERFSVLGLGLGGIQSVSQDLGDGVRAVGDGVGDAVEDVGNAVGDVVDGRE